MVLGYLEGAARPWQPHEPLGWGSWWYWGGGEVCDAGGATGSPPAFPHLGDAQARVTPAPPFLLLCRGWLPPPPHPS